ncbi:T9SS type A sorting domain-containing protein [Sediminibacterium ginsengisoli]|uniref:Por secretion system C-terminal sorting domain-containing protein n=1 Tax=Sediminibacterium ginsengisoli TaxID=413434 RepID=A0A1T4PYK9_9BACT|nr:T9SS type A sorting domain-containing protein [Sediminibacterium ginsengisoli]SJZ96058.1 Por secretion system C-terminal sorting domain-containing protein [Sediminibacterium ginsengisoli]
MKKLLRICLFFPAILFFFRIFGQVAPVPYPARNALYLQDFNSLPVTGSFSLPPKDGITLSAAPVNAVAAAGWQACMLSGSGSSAVFTTGTGSATTSAVYSFGNSGNTDRSLGTLASGTGIYAIGVLFTNQTGITLNSITVSFSAQQWRKGGSGNRNSWQCNYKTGIFTDILQQGLTRIPQLDFYSVHTTTGALTLNGRLQENQLSVSFTLTGITWKNGEQLLLRWDDTDEAGSDDAMAMDQFSFSADKVTSPPLIDTVFVTDTIQDQARITMRIHPNNAKTNIILFYDTLADFRTVKNVVPAGSPLSEDSGTTYLNAVISGLRPACRYFIRVAAGNIAGTVASPVSSFTIPVPLPVVSTLAPVVVSEQSAIATGMLVGQQADITEKGFAWSVKALPLNTDNKVISNSNYSPFTQQLYGLPSGTLIYLRAFATNNAGTGYGNTVSFYTKTVVSSLIAGSSKIITEDSATFILNLLQSAGDLQPAHFFLQGDGDLTGYSIKSIRRSGTIYTITVLTGNGSGTLRLVLQNDNDLTPGIQNIPYTATSSLYIDKSPPIIRSVSIRDTAMRVGDAVMVRISTDPDTDIFKLSAGSINNIQLASFSKVNDSSYTAVITILNGGKDLAAEDDISVRVILKDAAGNSSIPYTTSIKQPNDPVDANKPFVVTWEIPGNGVYKTNDTLNVALRFSEAVYVDSAGGLPSVQVTIGSRIRNCIYSSGSGSDRIWFSYPVQAGETARDGIRIYTPFLLNGSVITDLAGNPGVLTVPGAGIQNNIRIDAAAPAPSGVTVPAESTYGKASLVHFTVQFTKDVFVDTGTGKPFLLFTAGVFTRQAFYTGGSGTAILRFSYEVQQNDLAKKGLSLNTTLQLNGSVIRDSIGNAATPVLKNIAPLSKVYFDGIGPIFRNVSPQQVKICTDTKTVALSDYLETTDAESGELLTWRVINLPLYGQLTGFDAARTSLPNSITTPLSVYYLPSANGNTDSFSITVSDGVNNDTLRFVVIPTPAIRQQHAPAAQTICSGSRPQQLELAAPSDTGKLFTYQWESTTDTTKGFAVVTGTGNTLYYTPPALKTNTWFRRKNIAGHCTGYSDPVLITTMSAGLWLGQHSNDWHNTANWCNSSLPANSTDVLVQAGTAYSPVINAFAACNQLHIAANASLFIQKDLAVYGAVTGAGAINAAKGGLLFNGNTHQSIPSGMLVNGELKKLVVNNKTYVSLPAALTITGSVTMQTGYLFTNNNLTMAEDAIVEAGAQNAYIRGNVNILQQFRDAENSFLLLGHPFTTPVDPGTSYLFTDTAKPGYPASLSQYYSSLFRYDDSTGYLPFNHHASWIPLIGNWGQQQVIRIYPSTLHSGTDSFSQKTDRIWLSMSGELTQGDRQVSLAANEYTGYRAVTNPYLCPIDISCIGRSRGLAPYYWTWNPLLGRTGGYQCRLFGSPGLLAPSQVFFVKADANTVNELLFTENCKLSPATGVMQEDENYRIVLKLECDGILQDELRIYSVDSSKAKRDRLDAEKIMNPVNNLFSYSDDNHMLAIDARPVDSTAIIPIGISTPEAGVFTLTVAEKKLPRQLQFYLHDKQTDTWMALEKDNSYYFESGKADPQSQSKRFEIKAYPGGEKNTLPALSAFHIQVYPVPAREKINIRFAASVPATTVIQLFNAAGHKIKQVTPGIQKEGSCVLYVNDLARGIYILQARSGTLLRTQKVILQ